MVPNLQVFNLGIKTKTLNLFSDPVTGDHYRHLKHQTGKWDVISVENLLCQHQNIHILLVSIIVDMIDVKV